MLVQYKNVRFAYKLDHLPGLLFLLFLSREAATSEKSGFAFACLNWNSYCSNSPYIFAFFPSKNRIRRVSGQRVSTWQRICKATPRYTFFVGLNKWPASATCSVGQVAQSVYASSPKPGIKRLYRLVLMSGERRNPAGSDSSQNLWGK
jgi:hypothetical protein